MLSGLQLLGNLMFYKYLKYITAIKEFLHLFLNSRIRKHKWNIKRVRVCVCVCMCERMTVLHPAEVNLWEEGKRWERAVEGSFPKDTIIS